MSEAYFEDLREMDGGPKEYNVTLNANHHGVHEMVILSTEDFELIKNLMESSASSRYDWEASHSGKSIVFYGQLDVDSEENRFHDFAWASILVDDPETGEQMLHNPGTKDIKRKNFDLKGFSSISQTFEGSPLRPIGAAMTDYINDQFQNLNNRSGSLSIRHGRAGHNSHQCVVEKARFWCEENGKAMIFLLIGNLCTGFHEYDGDEYVGGDMEVEISLDFEMNDLVIAVMGEVEDKTSKTFFAMTKNRDFLSVQIKKEN